MSIEPCPFCGNEAELWEVQDHLAMNGTIDIVCDRCPATMRLSYIIDEDDKNADIAHDDIKDMWNKRATK